MRAFICRMCLISLRLARRRGGCFVGICDPFYLFHKRSPRRAKKRKGHGDVSPRCIPSQPLTEAQMQSSRGASQAARVRIGVFFLRIYTLKVRACTLKHTPIRCAALVYFRLGRTTAGLFFFCCANKEVGVCTSCCSC